MQLCDTKGKAIFMQTQNLQQMETSEHKKFEKGYIGMGGHVGVMSEVLHFGHHNNSLSNKK